MTPELRKVINTRLAWLSVLVEFGQREQRTPAPRPAQLRLLDDAATQVARSIQELRRKMWWG